MKYILQYYLVLASFVFFKYKEKLDISLTGRVFEGIAIGIYANIIDKFVDKGISFDLTIKLIIAIILTYAGIILSRKD